jgi:serine/threonine protein kinase
MNFQVGDFFAQHYQLKQLLGRGSFGQVWLAHYSVADVDVAVKIYSAVDDSGLQEFRDEFKIAYKLRHPNLLHINYFDVYEQQPYLVMPYCSRGSVARLAGHMTEQQLWLFVRDVANGLSYLHSQQPPIIHQDIKPDNILLSDDGKYVITDFGISRKLDQTLRSHTNVPSSSGSGTLAYMGPERFSETPTIQPAGDIWALGMSVYELLTNSILWGGMGGCVQLNGGKIPLMQGTCSIQMAQFIHSCLALKPEDRPSANQAYEYANYMLQHILRPAPQTPTITNSAAGVSTSAEMQEPSERSTATIRPAGTATYGAHANLKNGGNPPRWQRLVWVGLAAIIAGGIVLFSHLWQERREQQAVDDALTACHTLSDYRAFQARYPDAVTPVIARRISRLQRDSVRQAEDSVRIVRADSIRRAARADSIARVRRELEAQIQTTELITSPTSTETHSTTTSVKANATLSSSAATPTSTNGNHSAKSKVVPQSSTTRPIKTIDEEERFARNCRTLADCDEYFRRYPNGRFEQQVRRLVQQLEAARMHSETPGNGGSPPVTESAWDLMFEFNR